MMFFKNFNVVYVKQPSWSILLLSGVLLSGCTSVELGAHMYKACVVKSQDGCPTDKIREWMT